MSLRTQKENTIIGIGVLGMGLWYLSTKGDSPKAAKNPAFIYPQGGMMDDATEDKLIMAILKHRGYNKELQKKDGSKMSEEDYQLLLADFNAAIAYYPDSTGKKRPQKNLEKARDDLVQYKDQIVAKAEGVGMGPISGFSGVY